MAARKPERLERHDLKGARALDAGVGVPPPSLNARTAIVGVPDPMANLHGPRTERIQAAARLDILEKELALHKATDGQSGIDTAAYMAGRTIERALELERSVRGSSVWRIGTRVDNARTGDDPTLRRAEEARKIKRATVDVIGEAGWQFLMRFLRDGWSFSLYAEKTGKAGARGTSYVANSFRWMLTECSNAWAGRGKDRSTIRSDRDVSREGGG